MANEEKYTPRLKAKYKSEIAPALMKKFTYKKIGRAHV